MVLRAHWANQGAKIRLSDQFDYRITGSGQGVLSSTENKQGVSARTKGERQELPDIIRYNQGTLYKSVKANYNI